FSYSLYFRRFYQLFFSIMLNFIIIGVRLRILATHGLTRELYSNHDRLYQSLLNSALADGYKKGCLNAFNIINSLIV
ncbi:MAG: hypothetical protein ACLFVR_11360, partial [Thiohalospira sp.]